ncbi:RNA polymerase sigma factor SigI [Cytobacillus praedii]|uniref:RNA polymerase sigma factor SigI n=1 Tax=Cytobacillus praedii TaxID=1742358 RepID=UPI002E226817|nr:RNA polymerase sigma factor SigI [Cytobacillus praedii]
MLSMLFMAKKRKRTLEEAIHLIQQGDAALQNEIIDSYKPFIAKTVSSVCKRYIHESDDEFSIGLIAFNEAIQKFSSEKGSSLISFAEVLIKRRVIDYIRQQAKYQDLSVDFTYGFIDDEEQQAGMIVENERSLDEFKKKTEEELRREEIIRFTAFLREFELSFQDLLEQSPKHADARKNAMIVAKKLTENEELKQILLDKKRLPIKKLEKEVSISRKTIERNRKYIIAIALVLIGDYIYLKDYIKGVLET